MLIQEHQLLPLSIRENVALGAPDEEAMKDLDRVEESVRLCGAEGIVKNLSEGFQTILEPVSTSYVSFYGQGNKELEAIHKTMRKSANLSGERDPSGLFQRLRSWLYRRRETEISCVRLSFRFALLSRSH